MADVAQLGIAVDTSGLKAGSDQLRVFESVAKRTGETVNQVQARFAVAGKSFAGIVPDASKAGAALNALSQQHAKVVASTEKVAVSTGLARHEMINLSRQVQDVGVSLYSGQSPFTVLVQQGAQIADIFGSSKTGTVGGALKQVGSAIANFLTPMRLVGGAVAVVGAVATIAYQSWKGYALQLDDVARASGTTTTALQGLNSAAGFKGISNDEFFTVFRKFADSTYDARNNMGQLGLILRANGQTVGTTQQNFEKLADIIKNAKDDQQRISLLQQAGLPTTRQWIDYMSQGADGIRRAAAEATKLGSGTAELVAKAKEWDETWNKATTNASMYMKSWGQSALDWVTKVVSKSAEFAKNVAAGAGGGAPSSSKGDSERRPNFNERFAPAIRNPLQEKPSVDPAVEIRALQVLQQRIGLLGQTATVEQQVAAVRAQIRLADLQGIRISKDQADALVIVARAQAEVTRVQQQAQIGVFSLDAANRAAADTLKSWIAQKLLDPTNAQQMAAAQVVLARNIRETADAASVAASNFPQLQRATNDATDQYKAIDQVATNAMGNMTTGIVDVLDGTKSLKGGFADMSKSIIRSIEEMIVKMYVIAPLMNSLKSGLGSFGSFFGGGSGAAGVGTSAGGAAGILGSANGNIFAGGNVVPFARGGVFDRPHVFPMANGGIGLLGEAGPEAVMPLRRGADGKLGVAGAGGGAQLNVVVNNAPSTPNVSSRRNASGGHDVMIDFRDMMRGMVAEDAANYGPMSKALGARAGGFNGR